MTVYYTYIDDTVGAGSSTVAGIQSGGYTHGVYISENINTGIITSTSLGTGIITATSVSASSSITAPEFHGSFIGTVAGTASTASFATTAFTLNGVVEADLNVATANTALNLSGNPSISVGIVTATGGFISSASTTPIQINFDSGTNSITFSIAGIGTTSLVLF